MMRLSDPGSLSLGEYAAICRQHAKAQDDGKRLTEAEKDAIWEKVRVH